MSTYIPPHTNPPHTQKQKTLDAKGTHVVSLPTLILDRRYGELEMTMFKWSFFSRGLVAILVPLMLNACSRQPDAMPTPLPRLEMHPVEVTPFIPESAWKTTPRDWNTLSSALRFQITPPEALETRLQKDDREHWKNVLSHIELSQIERKDALVFSNLQISQPVECHPPTSTFSLLQRAHLQLTLQLHRNVLWRMGRLEMASRGVSASLRILLPIFSGGGIRNADDNVKKPIETLAKNIDTLMAGHETPRGLWNPVKLQFRVARTAHLAPILVQARSAFLEWQTRMNTAERWQYLANAPAPVIQAIQEWIDEYDALNRAFQTLIQSIKDLERVFAPPHAFVAYPCIEKNLRQMRIVSELYGHILPMQHALTFAADEATQVLASLKTPTYAGTQQEFLIDQVQQFITQIAAQQNKLTRAEDLLLITWDDVNAVFWNDALQVFVDPIHHHSKPAVENAQTWNILYREFKNQLEEASRHIAPEPPQPEDRRGKPYPPYISTVLETLHAPARIDEVERSLLAISELEAHMLSIRDELLKLCKQGACRSFPDAELANSPRTNSWIVSWRQSPANERTLGHSLVVIKLCQLHLSRLVQRLAEIYAWFAETSNADLSWKKLKAWQRIWTLYAEPNGTYATFLKSIAALDQTISDMTTPPKKRAVSPELTRLLILQDQFFDLTLDYARFIDAHVNAPTSFDDLIGTWDMLDHELNAIESATLQRDQALHPDDPPKPARQVIDIPR